MRHSAIRSISDSEVEFFRTNGWVVLRSLVEPEFASRLGEFASSLDRTDKTTIKGPDGKALAKKSVFHSSYQHLDDVIHLFPEFNEVALSEAMGANASALMLDPVDVRLFDAVVLVKDANGVTGFNTPTPVHQDFAYIPMDRSGGMTFWIALVSVSPEMGSLHFANGSHRFGSLGRIGFSDGDDLFSQHPWLKELEESPPITLEPGDATVHDFSTVHWSSANLTDKTRWSYGISYFPATARYTGYPHRLVGASVGVNELFDDPRHPLLKAASPVTTSS